MSVSPVALVLASGVQGGTGHPVAAPDTPFVLLVIVALAAACVPMFIYLRRRYGRRGMVSDQWRALAVMGELCPDGWQSQITLYGWGAPMPADAPPSRVPMVELEWKRFEEGTGEVAVARRVWAATIAEALQAMVEDRRADIALEEIERALTEDGEMWWND